MTIIIVITLTSRSRMAEVNKNSQSTTIICHYLIYSAITIMNLAIYQPKLHLILWVICFAILAILTILHTVLLIMAMKMTCPMIVMTMAMIMVIIMTTI